MLHGLLPFMGHRPFSEDNRPGLQASPTSMLNGYQARTLRILSRGRTLSVAESTLAGQGRAGQSSQRRSGTIQGNTDVSKQLAVQHCGGEHLPQTLHLQAAPISQDCAGGQVKTQVGRDPLLRWWPGVLAW